MNAWQRIRHLLTGAIAAFLTSSGSAEELHLTFGATSDLAVRYGDHDLTGNAKLTGNKSQNGDFEPPQVTVSGLDLDGQGANDDMVSIRFAITATGGDLALLNQGYRLDEGFSLTFEIESAAMKMGTGKSVPIDGNFVGAFGNNRGASFKSQMEGQRLSLTSTSAKNNRARRIEAKFDLPVDITKLAAPTVVPTEEKPADAKKSRPGPNAMQRNANPAAGQAPFTEGLVAGGLVAGGHVAGGPVAGGHVAGDRATDHLADAPPIIQTDSLRLPRLFCENMVLQQRTRCTFWGWAKPGQRIAVNASWGATASALSDTDGKWKLLLETPKHGSGHTLSIESEEETIHIKNVAVGEVWLCAGQSNMGWSMGNSFEAEGEANVDLPNLRIFKSAREHWHTPLELPRDRLSRWKSCNPQSAAETSAVSYYFGKKLQAELGIPVGIIQQAYAGTPIEGWMPWAIQKDDPRAQAHKSALDQRSTVRGSSSDALKEFELALAEYNSMIEAGQTMKNSVKALSPPIITKPSNLGHQYPGHQFNAMILPIVPYGIRGVIWYQGERNSKDAPQAANYRKQLEMLVAHYRSLWHKESGGGVAADFPFQFTQLPSWTPAQTIPVEGIEAPWAINREMMRLATLDIPNTAMAVSIDTGDAVALHPKNKKPIGIRHAYLALKQTYGRDIVDNGPQYKDMTRRGDKIVLEFDSVGQGLTPARDGELDAFAIAGHDRIWHWADAEIDGTTVVVGSSQVRDPIAVRYAWGMNPSQRNLLYNREGLPASPFRTDDWPLFDAAAEIVTVAKPPPSEMKSSRDWPRPKMPQ